MKDVNGFKNELLKRLEKRLSNENIISKDYDRVNSLIRALTTVSSEGISCLGSIGSLLEALREKDGEDAFESLERNTKFVEQLLDVQESHLQEFISELRGEIFLAKKHISQRKEEKRV